MLITSIEDINICNTRLPNYNNIPYQALGLNSIEALKGWKSIALHRQDFDLRDESQKVYKHLDYAAASISWR